MKIIPAVMLLALIPCGAAAGASAAGGGRDGGGGAGAVRGPRGGGAFGGADASRGRIPANIPRPLWLAKPPE